MFQRDAAGLPVRVRPSGGRDSALWSGPNMQFGGLPMQLADDVERMCNGQSAAARPPPIPSFAVVTWPRTAVSFPPATSRLCASLPLRSPSPNSQQPFQ